MLTIPPALKARLSANPNHSFNNELCWLWKHGQTPDGYGQVTIDRKGLKVHRLVYSLFKGNIPNGHQLDHLCGVKHCCNPNHLEPVTPKENTRRWRSTVNHHPGATKSAQRRLEQTQCIHGHRLDSANTLIHADGRRDCKTCKAIRCAAAYDKRQTKNPTGQLSKRTELRVRCAKLARLARKHISTTLEQRYQYLLKRYGREEKVVFIAQELNVTPATIYDSLRRAIAWAEKFEK